MENGFMKINELILILQNRCYNGISYKLNLKLNY